MRHAGHFPANQREEHRSRSRFHKRPELAALALALGLATGARAATVPASVSFEEFAVGYDIVTEADWSGNAGAGIVTNDATAIAALTTYTDGGGTFPLPDAAHEKVLQLGGGLTHTVGSATGGVVVSEMLFMPAQRDAAPAGSTNYQFACYVNTSDQLVIWHRGSSSNEWLTLTGSPAMETGAWYRVTIRKAYASQRYQVAINGGTPISDPLGWSAAAGGNHPGPWFDMVQTNGYMTRFRTEGDKTAFLDDMVFTNRSITYSGTTFAEVAANDGRIATTNTITLAGDTFANTTYSAGTHFSTSGVPAGLSLALAYVSQTQIEVSLTGTASPHTAAAGTSEMGLTLADAIFTLGSAADVSGYARGDLAVSFNDPPVLAYAPATFLEAIANNGSIGNTVTVTLDGDTFTDTTPFIAGTHFTTSGIPAGLGISVVRNDATTLTVSLTGTADAHGNDADTSMTLTFLNAAFNTVAAAHITESTKSLGINFADTAALSYSTTTYSETAANNGALSGGTIGVVAETFTGPVGTNYVLGGEVLVSNLPAGLGVAITKASDYQVTVSFSGTASNHTAADGTNTLTFAFQNAAFSQNNASLVTGSTRNDLVVHFNDPPVVSYSGTTFTEASRNNGTIGNSLTLTLTGDTFADGDFAVNEAYTVANEPSGLTLDVTRNSATQLTLALSGTATSHANSNDIANLTFALQNAAFATVAAANITGATRSNLLVDFNNQPTISYSRTVFSELSGGQIDNTTPIEITISGDTFTGDNGSDFVAAGKVTNNNVPAGLTLVLTRSSETKLLATLTGTAGAHASGNSISNLEITFLDTAITAADANQVIGYSLDNLQVAFSDSMLVVNTVPYHESFENYADGYPLAEAEGWQTAGGGVVTGETAIISALTAGFSTFPLVTNHTQVLRMTTETSGEIRSGSGGMVYSDMMFYVTARETAPAGSTDHQFAMYVDTNQKLNLWHRDTSGTPTNTWATLSGVTVATGAWHRVTVQKDYAAGRYSLHLDGSKAAVNNPTRGDTWFNMVGTANAYMSRVRVAGATATVPSYLDDLVVDTQRPGFFGVSGTIFRFR